MMKILLLEDDTVLSDILIDFLQESHSVTHTYSMQEALRLSEDNSYDLYIFDINVVDGDGLTLLRELRSFYDETPTIFITAFHDTKYLTKAFASGGNDFIRKPFELEELSARIENIKKHFGLNQTLIIGEEMELNTQTHILKTSKHLFHLTAKESELLLYLYKHKNRVVSTDEILQNLWKYDDLPSSDAVRTLIKELRKYVGKEHIINIRGEGYRFE
ncbi:response regulator transcription factor [Sulfurimonas sp. HSL-1716]|uniref:response regulator transcription factor n=1 Tax=Hydrocurvibacter sulfurireducens TaxID=3131937 RepID=UPI0031F8CE4D